MWIEYHNKNLDQWSERFSLTILVPFGLFAVCGALLTAIGLEQVPTLLLSALPPIGYMFWFILSDL